MKNEAKQITVQQVKKLKLENKCFFAYPRKGIICVDGFKYFQASKAAIKEAMKK